MASKNFCDRCEKEIEGLTFKIKAGTKDIDLCSECKKAFDEFINNENSLKD